MGMDKAKSLLPVRDGKSFLDLIVEQVSSARARYDVTLPLIFMNSFRTRGHAGGAGEVPRPRGGGPRAGLRAELRAQAAGRRPEPGGVAGRSDAGVVPARPRGPVHRAERIGLLDRLLPRATATRRCPTPTTWAPAPDATIAGWFAASGAPYAAEICRRTAADRKGGHLAIRKADRQLILRDTAQTAAGGDALLHRRVPAPVLPHQQPLVRPGGARRGR